ncbi:MAG: 3-oxoacyl-[acyl-carrier protein] reductase [Solirubrobacteraceae bacterium]|jgi:3-oxoacyl-[acyl-carrier protein] reductase|nr:3-oxoacyl-[acyl-carrier protein] reductase [Solirubrobacteraceae bacterium]
MADRYQQLVNTPIGRIVTKQIGLPNPTRLERYEPGQPVIDGPVLLGAAQDARLVGAVTAVLASVAAETFTPMDERLRNAAADAKLNAAIWNPEAESDRRLKALVFDATGIRSSGQLEEAWAFLHPSIRRVIASGRVIILGTPPEDCGAPAEAIAQRALEGLERAIAKEVKKGATAQLIYVAPGAESELESTLRFFLSPKSAFVSGQVVRVGPAVADDSETVDWERPLTGKVALVTGAARGIGASVAAVLARDGAHVVGLDVPAMSQELTNGMAEIGGSVITADITDAQAPADIASHLLEFHEGVDIVVHNAGVTRDKTLGRMSAEQWNMVIAINLTAPQRIDRELFERNVVRPNGRMVCVSSISGIAGNAGQTNYSTSKAGVIGIVQEFAPVLAKRGVTINAVAPGFIETTMTAAMPIAIREAGRRMNSLSQGGLPVDVAETIAWYASPKSAGVTGNVVRVCGQSLIGA